MMQRDILLKVWLFLSRPAARAKEKQRAQSPLRCRWTTTLRGTLNLRWQNQHQRKAHVEREREERFQNKKKSEMKYDAKRPSLSPDSPLYSPREREREIQKAPPPSSTHQKIIARTKKKTKKRKKKKNTKEYDTLNTSARKEPRFVVWVFLSLQFSSLKEERTLSRVCVSYHHRLCWIDDENDENEHRGLDDEDVVPIGRGRKRTRRGKRDVVDVAR